MSADLEILSVAQRLREGELTAAGRKELAAILAKSVARIREAAARLATPAGGKT